MPDCHQPLLPDSFYHIYSRAIGQEKLFNCEDNYRFFLSKYTFHTSAVVKTFAYCLLPNHFHFLIRCRSFEDIQAYYQEKKEKALLSPELLPDFIMERFSNWLNSYSKAFNKVNNRKGSLFIDYMRRQPVPTSQLCATTFYIHHNPVHHRYVGSFMDWNWSSYKSLLSRGETALQRTEVLDWFNGIEGFTLYHAQTAHLEQAVVTEG
jgi:REP element-mobilizing transposase RayT